MKLPTTLWRPVHIIVGAGVVILGLAMVAPAQAGGVNLSIGIGLPVPIIVAPAPVVVAPSPVWVYPPAVVVQEPPVVYGRPLPPGLAKKYYQGYPAYSGKKFHRHTHHGWDNH